MQNSKLTKKQIKSISHIFDGYDRDIKQIKIDRINEEKDAYNEEYYKKYPTFKAYQHALADKRTAKLNAINKATQKRVHKENIDNKLFNAFHLNNIEAARRHHKNHGGKYQSYSTMARSVPNQRIKTYLVDMALADNFRYDDISSDRIHKLANCGLHVTSAIGYDDDGKRHHKELHGFYCDEPYCPNRQQLKASQRTLTIETILRAVYAKYNWLPIFITLTVPSIKPSKHNVRKIIHRLTHSAKKMLDSKRYNGYNRNNKDNKGALKGSIIKLEVTYNRHRYAIDYKHHKYIRDDGKKIPNKSYGKLHYHLHIIGLVRKSYLKYNHTKYFINQSQWLNDWRKAFGDPNIESISVEKPYYIKHYKIAGYNATRKITLKDAKTKQDMNHILDHCATEIAKYTAKSTDFGKFPDLHKRLPHSKNKLFQKLYNKKISKNQLINFEATKIMLKPWLFHIKNNAFTADFRKFYNNKKSLKITNYQTHTTKKGNQISFHDLLDFTCSINDNNQFPDYFGAKNYNSNHMLKLIFTTAKKELTKYKQTVVSEYIEQHISSKIGSNATRKMKKQYIKKILSHQQLMALKAFHAILLGNKNQKFLIFRGYALIFKRAYKNGDLDRYKPKQPTVTFRFKITSDYNFKYKDYKDTADYLNLDDIKQLTKKGFKVDPEASRLAKIRHKRQKSAIVA